MVAVVSLPHSLVPMQPALGKPFHRAGWVFEEKYDGWRNDFRLPRGVTWLEPTLHVELTYSEIMEGRLRDPSTVGSSK
jgi:hypothetical protein